MTRKVHFVVILLITSAAFVFTGCLSSGTVAVNRNSNGPFGQNFRTPVKDFVTVGLVFTENQFQVDSGGSFSGDIFTYQELLKKAQERGGDAIINVVIEQRYDTENSVLGSTRKEIWYGSALAIKYTDTLRRTETITVRDASGSTVSTTTTTRDDVYFNDAGGQAQPGGGTAGPGGKGADSGAPSSPGGSLRERLLDEKK
ncbi:MAG: hypothetical protein LBQ14_05520 [Treponema sp.]|jgi:hypothetical protein|nr:hypothetical protein [Treponema sp.]